MTGATGRQGTADTGTGRFARARQWLTRARGSDGHERHTLLLVLKSAVAACVAWVLSYDLIGAGSPAFAPFSAVLMVQVTVYQSVAQSLRYVLAVVVGVAVQAAVAFVAGPDLLTFVMVTLVALALGRWRRLGAQGDQVATAAFFAFSTYVTTASTPGRVMALGEILLLVLVGCAVGILVNLLLIPPMRYRSAEYGVRTLAHALCDLVGDMSASLRENEIGAEHTEQWRYRAERMGSLVEQAHSAVRTAAESIYYNPRRLFLRHRGHTSFEGYAAVADALERFSGQLASMARTLDQSEELTAAGSADHAFVTRYGEFLAAIGEVTHGLSGLDVDRLGDQAGELCHGADAARDRHRRLSEAAGGSGDGGEPGVTDPTRTFGLLMVDATRLLDECQYTCDIVQRCADDLAAAPAEKPSRERTG